MQAPDCHWQVAAEVSAGPGPVQHSGPACVWRWGRADRPCRRRLAL